MYDHNKVEWYGIYIPFTPCSASEVGKRDDCFISVAWAYPYHLALSFFLGCILATLAFHFDAKVKVRCGVEASSCWSIRDLDPFRWWILAAKTQSSGLEGGDLL